MAPNLIHYTQEFQYQTKGIYIYIYIYVYIYFRNPFFSKYVPNHGEAPLFVVIDPVTTFTATPHHNYPYGKIITPNSFLISIILTEMNKVNELVEEYITELSEILF